MRAAAAEVVLTAIHHAQSVGRVCAFVDTDELDLELARSCGVDIADLLVSQPCDAATALEIVETLVRTGAIDLIVAREVSPAIAALAREHATVVLVVP